MTNEIAVEKKKPLFWEKFDPRNFGVRVKMQVMLLLITGFTSFTIGWLGYSNAKRSLTEVSFAQLISVRETKKRAVEDYFTTIQKQLVTLAANRMTVDAARDFKNAYRFMDVEVSAEQLARMNEFLREYYEKRFLPLLNKNITTNKKVEDFYPKDPKSQILQYHYISDNPHPIDSRNLLWDAKDGSLYSEIHAKFHPVFNDYIEKFDLYDLFIIDSNTGLVLYSVNKEVDYATSLLTDGEKDSPLGTVFRLARNTGKKDFSVISDFELYLPSYAEPSLFAASPIFEGEEKIGVLVLQISSRRINELMNGGRSWLEDGQGQTGETYLVGEDMKMRSNARVFIENPGAYFRHLSAQNVSQDTISFIQQHQTTILFQTVNTESVKGALNKRIGKLVDTNYFGREVLSAYAPVSVKGLNWSIISEISTEEAFHAVEQLRYSFLVSMLIIFGIAALLGRFFAKYFTRPIIELKESISKISQGELSEQLETKNNDEIGQTLSVMNHLIQRMKTAAEFAQSIGQGNFDYRFQALGERDSLGLSLTQMRDRLKEVSHEDKIRNWTSEGIAKFAEILRISNKSIEFIADQIISTLVEYMGANQGAIFFINDENKEQHLLEMQACYAYGKKKHIQKTVILGEGLAGRCWQEKDKIYINDVPQGFIQIRSGLGGATPTALLVVPIMFNRTVLGVIEMASFKDFLKYEIEFAEKIADNIGATISTLRVNYQTTKLLLESQQLTTELRQREEEMRQNTEELQATQEEMYRKQEELIHLKESLQQQIEKKNREIEVLKKELENPQQIDLD